MRHRRPRSRDRWSGPLGRFRLDLRTMLWLGERFWRTAVGEARRTLRARRLQ